jgi:hypothetical protein
MMDLAEKFQGIQKSVKDLTVFIDLNHKQIKEKVDRVLSVEVQTQKVNSIRGKIYLDLEKYRNELCNKLSKLPKEAVRVKKLQMYLKKIKKENQNFSVKFLVYKISQIFYVNEFKLFKKLRYYHLYDCTQHINSSLHKDRASHAERENFYRLSKISLNGYVAIDKKLNQIILYNSKFSVIRAIQIKQTFSCYQMKVINSNRIAVDLSSKDCVMTYIYIFDFDLNTITKKLINLEFLFIHFSQDIFFYRDSKTSNLIVYNIDLQKIDELENELKLDKNYLLIIRSENRLVLNSFNARKLGFITKDSYKLLKSVSTVGFSRIVIYADMKSNVYLGMFDETLNCYSITCTDVNGNVMFKQKMNFPEGEYYFFEDDYFYVFDKDYLLDSIN